MVRPLNEWMCWVEAWWDAACAVCLTLRTIIYGIIKVLYGLALLAGLFVIMEWAFDHQSPYRVWEIKPGKTVYQPGEYAHIIVDMEKLRNCQGVVTRSLGGGCGIQSVVQLPTTLDVGRNIHDVVLQVPEDTADGAVCVARISVKYACNPWDQLFPEEEFFPEVLFTVRKNTPFIEGGPGFMTP